MSIFSKKKRKLKLCDFKAVLLIKDASKTVLKTDLTMTKLSSLSPYQATSAARARRATRARPSMKAAPCVTEGGVGAYAGDSGVQ